MRGLLYVGFRRIFRWGGRVNTLVVLGVLEVWGSGRSRRLCGVCLGVWRVRSYGDGFRGR